MLLSGRPLGEHGDERYFVGRDVELASLTAAIAAGLNVLVSGPRGSGKTSLLRMAAQQMTRSRSHRVEFIPAPLSTGGAAGVLELLGDRLGEPRVVEVPSERHRALYGGLVPKAYEERPTRGGRVLAAIDRLQAPLREHLASVGGDSRGPYWEPGSPVVVMIDDVDGKLLADLFMSARDVVWRLPIVWVVACNTAGATSLYLNEAVDLFFELQLSLKALDDNAARELIRRRQPSGVQDSSVELVVDSTDRMPRALVSGARARFSAGRSEPPGKAQEAIEARAHAMAQVIELGRSALTLVTELQSRGGVASASDEALLQRLGWTRARASQVFGQLERAGLVESLTEKKEGAGRPRKAYRLNEHLR